MNNSLRRLIYLNNLKYKLLSTSFTPENLLQPLDKLYGCTSLDDWLNHDFAYDLRNLYRIFIECQPDLYMIEFPLTILNELIPNMPAHLENLLDGEYNFDQKCSRAENDPKLIDRLLRDSEILNRLLVTLDTRFPEYNITPSLLTVFMMKSIYHIVMMYDESYLAETVTRILYYNSFKSFCTHHSHLFIFTILCAKESKSEKLQSHLMDGAIHENIQYLLHVNREETCPLMKKFKEWYYKTCEKIELPKLWNKTLQANELLLNNKMEPALILLSNVYEKFNKNISIKYSHSEDNQCHIEPLDSLAGISLSHLGKLLLDNTDKDVVKRFLIICLKHEIDGDQCLYSYSLVSTIVNIIRYYCYYQMKTLKLLSCNHAHTESHNNLHTQIITENIFNILNLYQCLYILSNTWHHYFDIPAPKESFTFLFNERLFTDFVYSFYDIFIDDKSIKSMIKLCPVAFDTLLKYELLFDIPIIIDYTISRNNLLNDVKEMFDSYMIYSWRIKFHNEIADGDGPTKEFYSLLVQELLNPELNLWICKNETGLIPNPSSENLEIFKLVGMLMARAITKEFHFGIPFCDEIFVQLCKPSFIHLRNEYYIIPQIFPITEQFIFQLISIKNMVDSINGERGLTKAEKNDIIKNLTFDDGSSFDDLSINFVVPGTDIEMMDGGYDVLLSPFNIEQYLNCLCAVKDEIFKSKQLEAIRSGFKRFHPEVLDYFTPNQIKSFIGIENYRQWNLDELVKNCIIEDYSFESYSIKFLFDVLVSFNEAEQTKFLKFVTATTYLPLGGFEKLNPKLTIRRYNCDNPDDKFPTTHTCFNTLYLPQYSTFDITKTKILYAIFETSDSFQLV